MCSGGAPPHPVKEEQKMTLNNAVTAFAGFMVLLSLVLTYWVSPYWVWLTVFVGANLLQSAFTGFCPAAMIFARLGLRPAANG
jgi:fatty acid desaturase